MITVPPDGKKGIILAGNANSEWTEEDISDVEEAIADAPSGSVLVVNYEVAPFIVKHAIVTANQSVNQGDKVAIEKIAALYTSRDPAIACCIEASQKAVQNAPSFTDLIGDHKHAWERLWMRCDIEFEPLDFLRVTRLHLFHILQTVSPHTADLDAGVPSRGWHGEDYRGHIFWDEAFVLPFLIYRFPSIARSMLLYRHRRLNAARALARQHGCRGAMFPWRSASSGCEETPRYPFNLLSGNWMPDYTKLQHHISIIVAHTVWQYYTITDDIAFLCDHGAELLIEIARFWASLATYNEECDRYEICGVMGQINITLLTLTQIHLASTPTPTRM